MVACAGAAGGPDEGPSGSQLRGSDCISEGTVRDYRVLDDGNLIVTGSGRRKYHVLLSRRAHGLRSSWRLGLYSRSGMICSGFGEVVVADGTFRDSIRIQRITRLSPEDEEELLIRFGKIEGDTRRGPAPEPVDGAEVEELD